MGTLAATQRTASDARGRATGLLGAAAAALWLLGLSVPAFADGSSLDKARSVISGVYALAEWHADGKVYRPPQVDGRFIVLDGTITTILHNRSQAQAPTTSVYVGTYTLDSGTFSYAYEDVSTYTEGSSGASASHQPLWKGLRSFTVSVEGDAVHFRAASGPQEFVFTAAGVTYTDDGKPLRVWRRVTGR